MLEAAILVSNVIPLLYSQPNQHTTITIILPVFVSGRGDVKEDTLTPFNRHFRD